MNGIDYEYSQYLLRYGKFITDDFIGNARNGKWRGREAGELGFGRIRVV